MVHHQEAHVSPHGAARHGCDDGVADDRGDGAGAHRVRQDGGRQGETRRHRDGARLRGRDQVRPAEEPVVAGRRRQGLRPVADEPVAARTLPRLPDHRQQHRRAQRRSVRAAGDRRRSLPLERGVPDAVASAADAGLGRARRRVARPDLRAEVRAGDADPVDAAVHRSGRSGGRLLVWLLLRLHRHDQLGRQGSAAADDSRSAPGLRSAVRRRRDARRARRSAAPRTRASST